MKKTKQITGWFLLAAITSGGIAYAGPQASIVVPSPMASQSSTSSPADTTLTSPAPTSFADLTAVHASGAFDDLSSSTPVRDAAYAPAATYSADLPDDQHPMIPLPPGLWAGLVALIFVAGHTIRQQHGTPTRR